MIRAEVEVSTMANAQGLLMRAVERKLKELWPDWHIDKVLGNGAFGSV